MRRRLDGENRPGAGTPPGQETAAELREELEKIIASPEFSGSKRCQALLRYIVEKTLAGQSAELKERTLAVALYARPVDADLEKDSAVRVCASHVRTRLSRYYASAAGAASRWRIELPPGAYTPEFHRAAQDQPDAPSARPRRRWLNWRILCAALPAVSLAVFALWRAWAPPSGALDQFWGPALALRRIDIFLAEMPANTGPAGRQAADQAAAAAEISHFFRSRNCSVNIRPAEELSAGSVSGACVVIGPPSPASFGGWLMNSPLGLQNEPRLSLQIPGDGEGEWLADFRRNEANSAVLYRVPADFGRPFCVALAGLSPAATLAAARLAADPERLARLLQEVPQGWNRSGLALLLLFPGGDGGRHRLLSARLWQPPAPAP